MEQTLPGDSASLAPARDLVASFAADAGVDAEVVERAKLVVSELATNALQFAPHQPFVVSATAADGALAITVRSSGADRDVPDDGRFPDLEDGKLAITRRGLAIVHAICRSVTTFGHDDGTVSVTGEVPID